MPRKKRARVEKPPLHVVSLSGGKDSTAMLLLMVEQSMPIDMVVTADTGMEFPEMYRHWDQVEQYLLRKRGLKLTILRHPEGFERMMFDRPVTRAEEWQHVTPYGYGWPGIKKGRWCTGQLKTHLINKAVSQLRKTHKIFHYVGIAADEPERIKGEHYPLYDWGITEAQALQICYDRGFDWGGLYEIYHRCSCWCCPFQRIDELRKLRRHHPQLWAKLLDMDDRALAQFGHNALGRFKDHWTVAELEERFSAEDREISLFDSDKKKGADSMNVLVVEPGTGLSLPFIPLRRWLLSLPTMRPLTWGWNLTAASRAATAVFSAHSLSADWARRIFAPSPQSRWNYSKRSTIMQKS